ncbi:hypothetical protein F4809DRAFT_211614 [Biscogniauxia mediterranea]|nr:hypothetical protein F4809DRAFT_211614 [Biscogniauxia mediterranea]
MDHQPPQPFEHVFPVVKREKEDTQASASFPTSDIQDLEPGEVLDENKTLPVPPFEQDDSCYGNSHNLVQPQLSTIKSEGLAHVFGWGTPLTPQQHVYSPLSRPMNLPPQHPSQESSTCDAGSHQAQDAGTPERKARNHARLQEIVTRLQYVQGSVDDLLEIASIQQQIDRAWNDMTRAQNQLKSILGQFEREGCFTDKQSRRRDAATKEMTRKCQQISTLVNELSRCRRRQIQSNAVKQKKKGSA